MIVNPFEFSQYTSNFLKTNVVLDSSGIGLTGIDELMQFVVTQTKIRQEAIRIGYISNNPSLIPGRSYNLISLEGLSFDTPTSLYNASVKLVDAIKQMFAGHYSGLYESLAYKPSIISGDRPTDNVYYVGAGGFFHKITDPYGSEIPSDAYFETISELLDAQFFTQDDLNTFNNPVRYSDAFLTFNDYLRAHVVWVNSVIALINKLKYCNKKLVFLYNETSLPGVDPGAGCTFSYSVSSTTVSTSPVVNKPIEIILDMSEVVASCFDSNSSYGFLCIKWESTGSPSRFVIMPTARPGDNAATDILRKPIWGAPEVRPESNLPAIYNPTDPPAGYYDSSQYDSRASADDIFRTWDPPPGNGNVYQRQVLPILKSECITTDSTTPDLPFRNGGNGNEGADFACIKIDNRYFTTNTGSIWDYKVRLVIFPGCSANDSGMYWSLSMTCVGCTDCNVDLNSCGGSPNPPSSSSSSNIDGCNFNFSVNEPSVGVKERIIDLSGVPVGGFTGNRFMELCLSFYTGTIKDRLIIVATKGPDEQETSNLRGNLNVAYGDNDLYLSYRPFPTALDTGDDTQPKHPLVSASQSWWPLPESIIYDSGCIAIPSASPFKTIINISEDQVEFTDQTSIWYKKMRLLVFSGCDPATPATSSIYGVTLSCVTDECVPPSSSSSSLPVPSSSSSSDSTPSSSSFSESSSSDGGGTGGGSSSSSSSDPCASLPLCADLGPGVYATDPNDCSTAFYVSDSGSTSLEIQVVCKQCIDDPSREVTYLCKILDQAQIQQICNCFDLTWDEIFCCVNGVVNTYYKLAKISGKANPPPECDCLTTLCCCPPPVVCNCIGYGSTITMADGSQKAVEDIKVGDALLSAVFNDINSLDNPGVNDLKLGWSISGSDKILLVKTFVKSINIGLETSIYKFKENLYLTFEHPVLIGQPDGTFNFRSSYYINSDVSLIDYNLNEVYLSAPTLIQSRHVTFKIQTEPYNSFFAGGILVHSGANYAVQTPLGIGQIGIPVATNRYYETVYGTRNPNITIYDPGINNGESINDGLVLQPLNEIINVDSVGDSDVRIRTSSTSSEPIVSNRAAILGVYGSDIPAIWIKDAVLDLGRIDIVTFGDSNNNFDNGRAAALGGWSDGLFDAISKLGAKVYASPLTFFDGITEVSNNPSLEISSATYGYVSDSGSPASILNGIISGPDDFKVYFDNPYTRIRPNGKEINYSWLPNIKDNIWTSSLNFISINRVSMSTGADALNLNFQNKDIYYRVIYSPAVANASNSGLKGKLVLSASDGFDQLIASTEAETIIPSNISLLSKELYLPAGRASTGPITFYTSSSKFGNQYGSVGPFAFLMHSIYTNTNGFSISSLHSATGQFESIELINQTIIQHNRFNVNLLRQENVLLELYLSEISKRQLSRTDPFASSKVIIWINANPGDLNIPRSWAIETEKLISLFRSSWTNIGRTSDSIAFIVSMSPPNVPNDANFSLHRQYAKDWVLSQANTAFIDFSEIASYTDLFNSNYFSSPSDTTHLNTNGYRSISINAINNVLIKAENIFGSSSSSGGIIIIESSSSSSSSRTPAVLGDINGDCQISSNEIAALLNCWNSTDPACLSLFDYDGNGEVGSSDLASILNGWGAVATGPKSCVNPGSPIVWPIPDTCPDLNRDGILDCSDVNLLRQRFAQPYPTADSIYDFNGDGAINELDAQIILDFLQDPNNGPPGPKCIVCLIDQISSSSSGGVIIIESSSSSGGIIIIESSSSSSELPPSSSSELPPSSSSAVVSSSSSELPPSSSSEVISSSSSAVVSSSSSEVVSSSSSAPCDLWTSLTYSTGSGVINLSGCPLITLTGSIRWGETDVLASSSLFAFFLNDPLTFSGDQRRGLDVNGSGSVSGTFYNPSGETPTDQTIINSFNARCITCPPRPVCPDPVWNSFIGFNELSGAYPNGLSVENCGADKKIRAIYNSIDGLSLHYKLTVFAERVTTDTNHPSTDNPSDAWIRVDNGGSISFPADYWIAFALSNSSGDRIPLNPDIISVQVQYEDQSNIGSWINYGNAFNITVNISPNWLNFVGFKEDGYIFPNGNYQRYVGDGNKVLVVNYTHTVPAGSNTTPKLAYRISNSLTGAFANHTNAGIEYPNAEYPEWTVINSGDSILISNGEYLAFGLWHNGYFIDPLTDRTADRSVIVSLSEQFTADSYGNSFIISIDWCGRSFNPASLDSSNPDVVSAADLSILLSCWGAVRSCNCANSDLDGNGIVDSREVSILLNAWPATASASSSSSEIISSSSSELPPSSSSSELPPSSSSSELPPSSSSSELPPSSSSSYQLTWADFTGYNGVFTASNGRWGNSEFITSTIGYRTLRATWINPSGNDVYLKAIQLPNFESNSSYHVPDGSGNYPGFGVDNGGTFGFDGPGVSYAYTAFAIDPIRSNITSNFTMQVQLDTQTVAEINGVQILIYDLFATFNIFAFNFAAPSSSSFGPITSSSSSGPGEESSISSGSSSSSELPPSSSSSKIIVP